jgi:hypothetical protein
MKLQKELAHLALKTDKAAFLAHKKYVKSLHKQIKHIPKKGRIGHKPLFLFCM